MISDGDDDNDDAVICDIRDMRINDRAAVLLITTFDDWRDYKAGCQTT